MRYIHNEPSTIREYIVVNHLNLQKCNYDGSSCEVGSADDIEDMLNKSNTLWGLRLPYYIRVSQFPDDKAFPLGEAVSTIEASAADDKFLVVAYQDGGIITVSAMKLPFQVQATPAEWWRP